jgi:hypothetical protein
MFRKHGNVIRNPGNMFRKHGNTFQITSYLSVTCFGIYLLSVHWGASFLAMTPDAIADNNGISVIATARYEAGSRKQSGHVIFLLFI